LDQSGVVDQNIDATKSAKSQHQQVIYMRCIANIGGDGQSLSANMFDFINDTGNFIPRASDQDHIGTCFGQGQRRGSTNASPGPGNNRYLTFKQLIDHSLLLSKIPFLVSQVQTSSEVKSGLLTTSPQLDSIAKFRSGASLYVGGA
jgi:hypothetical protein